MTVVAVAGAGGFIGSHVVESLRAAGRQVVAIDRPGSDLAIAKQAGAETLEVDLLDEDQAITALEGAGALVNATGMFHLGATEADLERVNVTLTDRLVRSARAAGVERVVQMSSVAVYGRPTYAPQRETGPLRPRIAYERTKLAGERIALSHDGDGIEVAALRPTLVYGPRSKYGQALMIALVAQARALGLRSIGLLRGGPLGHHVHAEDVARAAALLVEHPDAPGRAFNVADDAPVPHGDAMCAIAEAVGLRVSRSVDLPAAWPAFRFALETFPDVLLGRLNRRLERGSRALEQRGHQVELKPRFDADWPTYATEEFVYDTRRIKALGFELRHPRFVGAITDVVAWYYDAGWLPAPGEPTRAERDSRRPKARQASA